MTRTMAMWGIFFIAAAPVATNGLLDWPQWGRNPQYTSYVNVPSSSSPHRTEWTVKAGDRVVGSPAVGLGRVWFGSDDGYMRCVNASTGESIWEFLVPPGSDYCESTTAANFCEHGLCPCNKVRSDPAIDESGSVYFGSYDRNIYKVDINGRQQWKVSTGGAVYGPVTLDKASHTLYVGSFDSNLYAIDTNGTVKWTSDIGSHADVGWALGEKGSSAEHLIFGQSNEGGTCTQWPPPDCPSTNRSAGGGYCYVFAIHRDTGKEVWKAYTGQPGGGGMVVGDTYYMGNWNDYTVAFEALSGKVRWMANVGGSVESHPAYYNGMVLISTESTPGSLYALNESTGATIWTYSGASEEFNGSPSVNADTVFVGSNDHYLHAVDLTTGAFKYKVETCANVFSSAAIDLESQVYIGCNTVTGVSTEKGVGQLYSINPTAH